LTILLFAALAVSEASAGKQSYRLQTVGGILEIVKDEYDGKVLLDRRENLTFQSMPDINCADHLKLYLPNFSFGEDVLIIREISGGNVAPADCLIGISDTGATWIVDNLNYTDYTVRHDQDNAEIMFKNVSWEGTVQERYRYINRHIETLPASSIMLRSYNITTLQQLEGQYPAELFTTVPQFAERVKLLFGDDYSRLCCNLEVQSQIEHRNGCYVLSGLRAHMGEAETALLCIVERDLSIHGVIVSSEHASTPYVVFSETPAAMPAEAAAVIAEYTSGITGMAERRQ